MSETHQAFEQHYRVNQIAKRWNVSRQTVTREFQNNPLVRRKVSISPSGRTYTTLMIPESEVIRTYEEWSRGLRLKIKPLRSAVK